MKSDFAFCQITLVLVSVLVLAILFTEFIARPIGIVSTFYKNCMLTTVLKRKLRGEGFAKSDPQKAPVWAP